METAQSARDHRVALEALAPRRLRRAWVFEGREARAVRSPASLCLLS